MIPSTLDALLFRCMHWQSRNRTPHVTLRLRHSCHLYLFVKVSNRTAYMSVGNNKPCAGLPLPTPPSRALFMRAQSTQHKLNWYRSRVCPRSCCSYVHLAFFSSLRSHNKSKPRSRKSICGLIQTIKKQGSHSWTPTLHDGLHRN